MKEINAKYLEEYTKLDDFLKDMLSCDEGVISYAKKLETNGLMESEFYKELKHLNWLKNKLLSEEETVSQDLVEDDDIKELNNIYESFLKMSDPLSRLNKKRAEAREESEDYDDFYDDEPSYNKGTVILLVLILIALVGVGIELYLLNG